MTDNAPIATSNLMPSRRGMRVQFNGLDLDFAGNRFVVGGETYAAFKDIPSTAPPHGFSGSILHEDISGDLWEWPADGPIRRVSPHRTSRTG